MSECHWKKKERSQWKTYSTDILFYLLTKRMPVEELGLKEEHVRMPVEEGREGSVEINSSTGILFF